MDKTIKDWFHELPKLNLEKTNIKKCKARSKIIPATIAAILSILSIVQNTWIKGIIMVILNALSIATQGFYSNRLDYIIEEKKEKENEGYKKTISDLKNELEYEKQLSFVRDSLTRSLDDVLDKRIETERVNYLIEIIGFSTEAFHSNDKQMILDKVTQPIESYLDIMGDLVVKAFEVANTAEGGAA